MAFVPYIRLVIGGTIDSVQGWSFGLSLSCPNPPTNSELFTWLATVDTAAKVMFQGGTGNGSVGSLLWDTATTYNKLKAYYYGAVGDAQAQAQVTSTGFTGTLTSHAPRQCAIVASLRSGIGSRAGRGRIYIPCTASSVFSTGGQISAGNCTTLSTGVEQFISTLNASTVGGDPVLVGIASRDAGVGYLVQDVVVNSLVDTQRRRTDKLVASSQTSTPVT